MIDIDKIEKDGFFDYCFTCYSMMADDLHLGLTLEHENKIKEMFVKLRESQPQTITKGQQPHEYVFEVEWDMDLPIDSIKGLVGCVGDYVGCKISVLYTGVDLIKKTAFINFLEDF